MSARVPPPSARFAAPFAALFAALRCGAFALLFVAAGGQGALADPAQIARLLRSSELFALLQQESQSYGEELGAQMAGGALPGWREEVAQIYAPEKLVARFEAGLGAALAQADARPIERWLEGAAAQRVIALELEARQRMLDPEAEAEAMAAVAEAEAAGDAKLAAVRRVIAASGVIETNVVGGLNANFAFYRAMAAHGAFPYALSEAEMLAEVAAQEEAIRADVTLWVEAYLYQAYQGLSLPELDLLAEFLASPPGQRLLAAEIAAFDQIYEESSAELGRALARHLRAQEL